jgi:hypothetical protein
MHELQSEKNILDRDLAFSSSLLGKECNKCRRAYRYNYFNRSSWSRDGYSHVCPECEVSPRLSTEEHVSRLREMNDSSQAVEGQRRPNELEYLERDSVGRALYHSQFIDKLKQLLGTKLIVGDAYFLNEFSLYIQDSRFLNTNGVRYIGYIPSGRIQEFSSYTYDKHSVAIDEHSRGYRGILMKLIVEGYITEQECARVFGPCEEKVWCRTLYNWRKSKV